MEIPQIKLADVPLAASPSVYIVDKPGAGQSYIFAAEIGISGNDKSADAVKLMNNMLGGTFLSCLNMNLREDKNVSPTVFAPGCTNPE